VSEIGSRLRFGSKMHTRVMSALDERRKIAYENVEETYERWKDNEERYLAYMPESESDSVKRMMRDSGQGPQTTTLIIPMSYALLMTWHTYMTTVMLGRHPVHQWEGRTEFGQKGKMSVETLMEYQTRVGEHLVPYYVWLLDTGKYGLGVVGHHWLDETAYVTEVEEVPLMFAGLPVGNGKTVEQEVVREIPGYEGNRLYNIHPTKALFDPRVPLMEYQRGEFVIVNIGAVSKGAVMSSDRYFNKDVVKHLSHNGKVSEEYRSGQIDVPDEEVEVYEPHDAMSVGTLIPEEYYVRLVPKHWGLGDNDQKEIWVFTVVDRQIIIGAAPLGSYTQKFPIRIQEHEPDGHQLTKRSFLDIVGPLQDFLDWLINTHRLNVAKALNDTLIVDPSLVHMSDVRDPLPGKLIRAKPQAYGQGVLDKAIHQVRIQDVTQQHLQTTSLVMQMMQRVSGVTEQVMGMLQPGGRKTAQEIRTSATFGVNRLKTETEFLSASAWQPLALELLANTQQYMSREVQLRMIGADAGLSARDMEQFLTVTPDSIRGFYDYIPVDGSLPIDRMAQAQVLMQLMGQMGQVPGVLAQYDMGGAFSWIAELMGAKGLKNFKIQLTEDEIVKRQLQEGNLMKSGDVKDAVGLTVSDTAFLPGGGGGGPEGASEGGPSEEGASAVEDAA
jgi:hypothetical protein